MNSTAPLIAVRMRLRKSRSGGSVRARVCQLANARGKCQVSGGGSVVCVRVCVLKRVVCAQRVVKDNVQHDPTNRFVPECEPVRRYDDRNARPQQVVGKESWSKRCPRDTEAVVKYSSSVAEDQKSSARGGGPPVAMINVAE